MTEAEMTDAEKLNRRSFLETVGGVAVVSSEASGQSALSERAFVMEKPRKTPVAQKTDVVIIGGGPTGVGAAFAAASEGAKVLIVERYGMLGGIWTNGLMNPLFDPRKGWIVGQLTAHLQRAGAWRDFGKAGRNELVVFDVEVMKYALEQMMAQAKVEYWYHSHGGDAVIEGDRVIGAFVESKSGREAVLGKVVIDCSGDGDLSARAGIPFQFGRKRDGRAQPGTLMFEIDNMQGLGSLKLQDVKVHEIYTELQEAIAKHNLPIRLPYGRQRSGTPFLIAVPRPGAAVIQATQVCGFDSTDTRSLTRATVEGRRQIHEIFMPALHRVPGLEECRLTISAGALGVRESRHLEGRYTLDLDDILSARKFDDAVTSVNFGIDIHEIDPADPTPRMPPLPANIRGANGVPMCDIPYRCLLPKDLKGLLFAGRCISGTHVAHAAYRVTGTCMAMGQAAGLAAAMAVKQNIVPSEIDGAELHRNLVERGVVFGQGVPG